MFVVANIIDAVAVVAHMLVSAYILVILAACVVSWLRVPPDSQAVRVLWRLTEPVFELVRRKLPFTRSVGALDLSPLAALVVLELFDLVVLRSLRQLAAGL